MFRHVCALLMLDGRVWRALRWRTSQTTGRVSGQRIFEKQISNHISLASSAIFTSNSPFTQHILAGNRLLLSTMASLALSSLSRAPLRLSEFHCVTLRPIVASFSAKSRFSTIRQVHSNRARHVNRTAVVPKSLRSISTIPNASRYPQGPTPEGLRIVVQAMQRGPGQLQTRYFTSRIFVKSHVGTLL